MPDDSVSLEDMVEEADTLAARAREAQHTATLKMRGQDPLLAELLDQLWADTTQQANWLFKRHSAEQGRPMDLIISGHTSKVRELISAILHGVFQ